MKVERGRGGRNRRIASLLLVGGILFPARLQGQSLAQRLAAAPDGTVRFSFAAREGVCGNGRNITTARRDDDWEGTCDAGPVRVALTVRGSRVSGLRTYVGGRWRAVTAGVVEWGTVPAPAAATFLLALARAPEHSAGEKAVFAATLADSIEVWADLLAIARDRAVPASTRKQAVFWMGQAAGDAATRGLDSLVRDPDTDRPLQEQVVFALSQRPRDEGVPALIRVARSHRDPAIRKKALFWLGQSDDPRALALFEELLTRD